MAQISITGTPYGGTGGVGGGGGSGPGLTTDGSGTLVYKLTGDIPVEDAQDFRVASESGVQSSKAIGAANVGFFPRGNKQLTWSFTVQREHADAETAAFFCLDHEEPFPVQGTVKFVTAKGNKSYPGAVAWVTQLEQKGATTIHAYRIVSGGSSAGAGGGLTTD